jgi:glycosyltransferase involved in cell wall biosynthesis
MADRIAFVIDELEVGGTQRQMLGMAVGLAARGVTVHVVCLTPILAMAPEFEAAGIPVRVIARRGRLDVRLIRTLARFFRAERIQVVHAFSSTAEFFAGLAARAVACGFVASVRGFQEDLPLLSALGKRLACRLADAVVANSEAGGQRAVTSGVVPGTKLRVVPNGLARARLVARPGRDVRQELGVAPDACLVLSAGRLVWEKGYDLAVAVAAQVTSVHPGVRFLVAGDGPLRVSVEGAIRRHGVERAMVLLGERHDVPDLLAAADIYLSASRSEGLSNAVMEAMAVGLPVVASAVGGTPELVRDGVTGYLFAPDDAAGAARRIGELILDVRLRHALGESARQRIAADYDTDTMLARLAGLYDSVATGAA